MPPQYSSTTGRQVLNTRHTWRFAHRYALFLLFTVWELSEAQIARLFTSIFPEMSEMFAAKLRDQFRMRWQNGRRELQWRTIDRLHPSSPNYGTAYTPQELNDFATAAASVQTSANQLGITLVLKVDPMHAILRNVPSGTAGISNTIAVAQLAPAPATVSAPVAPIPSLPVAPASAPTTAIHPAASSLPAQTYQFDSDEEADFEVEDNDDWMELDEESLPVRSPRSPRAADAPTQYKFPGLPTMPLLPMIHTSDVHITTSQAYWVPSPARIFSSTLATVDPTSALYRLGGRLYSVINGPAKDTAVPTPFAAEGSPVMLCNANYCSICAAPDSLRPVADPYTNKPEDSCISSSDITMQGLLMAMHGRPVVHSRDISGEEENFFNDGPTLIFNPHQNEQITPYAVGILRKEWEDRFVVVCPNNDRAQVIEARVCKQASCHLC